MRSFIVLLSCLMNPALAEAPSTGALVPTDAVADPVTRQLIEQARGEGRAWAKLDSLCTDVGHRLSGSSGMVKAVRWAESTMAAEGLSKVWTESVQVPHWVRGEEKLTMLAPHTRQLAMLGLGSSVGTPGVEAEVVVVDDWEQLGPHVKGKIVLYNVPMPEGVPSAPNYGATVGYRLRGADKAAAHGAVRPRTQAGPSFAKRHA